MVEWSDQKKFNPFNSDKILVHLERFRKIKRGEQLPPPVTISTDLCSRCNLKCNFCNAYKVMQNNQSDMSKEAIKQYLEFLNTWNSNGYSVKSTCGGGNGESTLNPHFDYFIDGISKIGIKVGLVTNGININHNNLGQLEWIGVSIDAGTRETYKQIKGADAFLKVVSNLRTLSGLEGKLNSNGQGHGISYKYLLHPQNINEIYEATKIAKDSGCRNIHIRPVSNPWDRNLNIQFTEDDLNRFREQLSKARELEDIKFGVFGITHKFSGNLQPNNDFNKCYGILMSCAISPPRKEGFLFTYQACCDRRGDERYVKDFKSFEEFRRYWGSDEHWNLAISVNPKRCVRCTLKPHINIYEKCILEDSLTEEFI